MGRNFPVSYTPDQEEIYQTCKTIAIRERVSFSRLVMQVLTQLAHDWKSKQPEHPDNNNTTKKQNPEPQTEEIADWKRYIILQVTDPDHCLRIIENAKARAEEYAIKNRNWQAIATIANEQWSIKHREAIRNNTLAKPKEIQQQQQHYDEDR